MGRFEDYRTYRTALGGRYEQVQAEVTALWNAPHARTLAEKAYFKKFGHKNLI